MLSWKRNNSSIFIVAGKYIAVNNIKEFNVVMET